MSELWCVTAYFNPGGYLSRLQNFQVFRDALLEQGVRLLTIECAFGASPFMLQQASNDVVLRVRAMDIMWQKERLLNLAISSLPESCSKVVWLDCDIIFEEPSWWKAAEKALDSSVLLQPFDTAIRLPAGHTKYTGQGELHQGFVSTFRAQSAECTGEAEVHGHPGFAWAARREWLSNSGLYDACIIGGGDLMMAHAFVGQASSPCLTRRLGPGTSHHRHYHAWSGRVVAASGPQVGLVPGRILHLWHGEPANRRYFDRHLDLRSRAFDPKTDLRIGSSGCWEWTHANPELEAWVAGYVTNRREDG